MAIKHVRTLKTIRALSSTSQVASFNFRSPEEVAELVGTIKKQFASIKDELSESKMALRRAGLESAKTLNTAVIIRRTPTDKTKTTKIEAPAKPEPKKAEPKQVQTLKTYEVKRDYKKGQADKQQIEFVAPPLDKLKKNSAILTTLSAKIDAVDTAIAVLDINFRDSRKASPIVKAAQQLRKEMQAELQKALIFLENIATKHEPEQFKAVITPIIDSVLETFEGYYDKYNQMVYATPYTKHTDEHAVEQYLFTHYLELQNFANDEGETIPRFYLVFSCLVDPLTSQASFYVTNLHSFASPGKFSLGQNFKDTNEGKTRAFLQLEAENYSALIGRKSLPVSQQEVTDIKWNLPKEWIKKVTVENDTITVLFTNKVKKDNKDKAVSEVLVDLKSFFKGKVRGTIRYRPFTANTLHGADYILVVPDRTQLTEFTADANRINILVTQLGLSQKQATEFVKLLNKVE